MTNRLFQVVAPGADAPPDWRGRLPGRCASIRRNGLGALLTSIQLTAFLACAAVGCSDANDQMVVRRAPAERPDLNDAIVAGGALRIPAESPFNLRSFESSQKGNARGEAAAEGEDGVACRVQAKEGGEAAGWFHLGYTFDNLTSRPLDARIHLRATVTTSSQIVPPVEPDADTTNVIETSVTFVIRDSNGYLVKQDDLVLRSTPLGPSSDTRQHDVTFAARFEPDVGYYVYLNGRLSAKADAVRQVEGALTVRPAAIDVIWQPAASASAAPSE